MTYAATAEQKYNELSTETNDAFALTDEQLMMVTGGGEESMPQGGNDGMQAISTALGQAAIALGGDAAAAALMPIPGARLVAAGLTAATLAAALGSYVTGTLSDAPNS